MANIPDQFANSDESRSSGHLIFFYILFTHLPNKLLSSTTDANGRGIYSTLSCIFRIYFLLSNPISRILGIRWEIRNASNIVEESQNAIFISNHQCIFDTVGKNFTLAIYNEMLETLVGTKCITDNGSMSEHERGNT